MNAALIEKILGYLVTGLALGPRALGAHGGMGRAGHNRFAEFG